MNSRPRILWLSHFMIYPPHGGARIRSYNLLRELALEFDIDLVILDQRSPGTHRIDLDRELTALREVASTVLHCPLERNSTIAGRLWYFVRSLASRTPVTATMLFRSKYLRQLRELTAATKYAAVHIDNVELALYLPAFAGVPIVLNHHNVESDLLRRQARYKSLLLRWYFALQSRRLARFEEQVCPIATINLTVSDLDGSALLGRMPTLTVTTIHNGVDLRQFRFDPARYQRSARNLIWIGGMHWFPNQDAVRYFLRAIWPLIAGARPDVRLILVGQNPPPNLRAIAHRDRIEAPGYVADIAPYLARGDVYVVPIRVGSGTRLKILDAFAAGIPLVSTPVGCEGLEVADGEELLIRRTAAEFGAAVVQLLDDPVLRERLARRARALVEERHSWTSIGERLRQAYRGIQPPSR